MIKDLTRKATNDKLTTKQVDKILQQKDITKVSNDIFKTTNKPGTTSTQRNFSPLSKTTTSGLKANYSSSYNPVKSPKSNKSVDKPNAQSVKSKQQSQSQSESYYSNLENCKYIRFNHSFTT
jgi:hypothetical protein